VTLDSFKTWKAKFDHDMAIMKAKEKMKGMTAKERDEYRRIGTRPSGKIVAMFDFSGILYFMHAHRPPIVRT
jgi:hypothetical protein